MSGLISGIKRLEIHDGDGLRTTVFFKGCPLRCIWCHNPETFSYKQEVAFYSHKCVGCEACVEECPVGAITKSGFYASRCIGCFKCTDVCPTEARTLYGKEYEARELADILLSDREFFENGGGGVTFSGGECLTQIDFAVELAKILFDENISIDIDTCGYVSKENIDKIIPYTDTFLYDLKAIDSDVHINCTGRDNKIILDNLTYLSQKGCKIEIRYPLVVGYNDGECEKIGKFLSNLKGIGKVKVLRYHAFASSKYEALGLKNTMPNVSCEDEHLERAVEILKSYGLNAINGDKED